jgi:hypothetical protein
MGLLHSKRQVNARAMVIGANDSKWLKGSVTAASAGNSEHTLYRVRIVPEDGRPEFESVMSTWGQFAHYGTMIHDFWIYVVYDPDAPQKCQLDKEWLDKIDLADWFAEETRRRHREQSPGGTPGVFPPPQAGGTPASDSSSAATDPVAYWKQYAEGMLAKRESAAAKLPQGGPPASTAEVEARLAAIDKLHQAGALSDEEYQTKRQQIIDSI